MPDPRPRLDDAAVAREVAILGELGDVEFGQAVLRCVRDPLVEEVAALRSPALAARSHRAVRLLIRQANNAVEEASRVLRVEPGNVRAAQGRVHGLDVLARLGAEQQALRRIVDAHRVARGEDPSAPNAASRAHRELARLHPVEFVALKRAAEAAIAGELAADKARRRAARVDRRSGGRVAG